MKRLFAINTTVPPLLRLVAMATTLSLCGCSQDTSKTPLKIGSSHWVRVDNEAVPAAQPEEVPTINPETFLATGRLMESQGNLVQAAKNYQQACQARPDYVAAWNRLGIICDKLGRYGQAEEAFNQAIQRAPKAAFLHNNLGFSCLLAGKYSQAEKHLRQALKLNGHFQRARMNLGLALAKQDQFDAALGEFKKVLPEAQAYYNLGYLHRQDSRWGQAGDCYKRALEIDPSLADAKVNLAISQQSQTVISTDHFETDQSPSSVEVLETDQDLSSSENVESGQTASPAENVTTARTGNTIEHLETVETADSFEAVETQQTGGVDEGPKEVQTDSPAEEVESGQTSESSQDITAVQSDNSVEDLEAGETNRLVLIVEDLKTGESPVSLEGLKSEYTGGLGKDRIATQTVSTIEELETEQATGASEHLAMGESTSHDEDFPTGQSQIISNVESLANTPSSGVTEDLTTIHTIRSIDDHEMDLTATSEEDFAAALTITPLEELETDNTSLPIKELVTEQSYGLVPDIEAGETASSVENIKTANTTEDIGDVESGETGDQAEDFVAAETISITEDLETEQTSDSAEAIVISQTVSPDEDLATAQTTSPTEDLRTAETLGAIEDLEPEQTSGSGEGPETAQVTILVEELAVEQSPSSVEDPETGQIISAGENRNTSRISSSEHVQHCQAVERTIAIYENLLASKAGSGQTIRRTLDGEIQWRLALGEVLLKDRAEQSRFAVEELGLGGAWAADLSSTVSRAEQLLENTADGIDGLIGRMRADAQFEQNYVATGLYLRATKAKARVDHYRGWTNFYRALVTAEQNTRQELLQGAIELLRQCCSDEAGQSGFAQLGAAGERLPLRNQAVFLMIRALHYAGQFSEADKLLTWLEQQSPDEQMAYEAGLQRCRLLRDQGHHDTALAGLSQVRSWCRDRPAFKGLPVRLTLAYLECTILAGEAEKAAASGELASAGEFSRKRLDPLTEILTADASEYVRSIVYEQVWQTRLAVGPGQSVPVSSPLEMLAAGVSLAGEGKSSEALKLFDELLSRTDSVSRKLHSEVLWQRGQATEKAEDQRIPKDVSQLEAASPSSPLSLREVASAEQIAAPETEQPAIMGEDLETSE